MDCMSASYILLVAILNTLNTELNPICHLLALLGVHHFLHVSRIRVKNGGGSIHSQWTGGEWWVCTNEDKCQVEATDIKFLRGIKRCTLHDMMQNKNTTQELNIFLDLDKIRDNKNSWLRAQWKNGAWRYLKVTIHCHTSGRTDPGRQCKRWKWSPSHSKGLSCGGRRRR